MAHFRNFTKFSGRPPEEWLFKDYRIGGCQSGGLNPGSVGMGNDFTRAGTIKKPHNRTGIFKNFRAATVTMNILPGVHLFRYA
jgi:hypothetical protein